MQRMLLTQEDQKVVNHLRLIVATIYSSIALVLVLFIVFSSAVRDGGSSEARTNSKEWHALPGCGSVDTRSPSRDSRPYCDSARDRRYLTSR
jgi:hypothetical protein